MLVLVPLLLRPLRLDVFQVVGITNDTRRRRRSTELLVLEEGDEPQYIQIRANTPPSFLCSPSASDCRFMIGATVQDDTENLACVGGGQISQVVLGSYAAPELSTCGFTFSLDNWQDMQHLPVEAKRDGIVDGNQEQRLNITVTLYSLQGSINKKFDVTSLQVSLESLSTASATFLKINLMPGNKHC